MASTRDLRRRIRSITSTAQITRAMQMVAASKMRKAQQAALDCRPFARLVYRIQREATTRMGEFSHPLIEVRDVRKRAVILVGADKGLCGALNSNLFRWPPNSTLRRRFSSRPGVRPHSLWPPLAGSWPPSLLTATSLGIPEARAIAGFAADLFLKKEVDEVRIVATQFINTLTQQALSLEFLPVGEIKALEVPGRRRRRGGDRIG